MSVTSEEMRERQQQARARTRLRQRIERARWRRGRRDWIVADTELDAILASEKLEKTEPEISGVGTNPACNQCVTAHKSATLPPVAQILSPVPPSAEQVFNLIRGGVQTWDALLKQTRLDDESLGLALADLFNERRIRLQANGEARIYEAARH